MWTQQTENNAVWVCTITIRHNNQDKQCRFFVVSGYGPVLLGIPDIEIFHILSVKCRTIEPRKYVREINEENVENKPDTKKN